MMVAMGSWVWTRLSGMTLAVFGCALGRGLDLATTWVALQGGRALEAQPLAAHLCHWLGVPAGIVAHEAFITTPAIFLGYRLVRRTTVAGSAPTDRIFFLLVGVVSACAALHNSQFVF